MKEDKAYIGDEIVEGNCAIAEFMGGKLDKFDLSNRKHYRKLPHGRTILIEDLKYHSSFDWLMPVVKKVSDVINPINWDKIVESLADVDIVTCHTQLVLSIKWYNQNKQS